MNARLKVFVLDDSPLRLAAFHRHLDDDHNVWTASNAKDAIDILKEQDFDVIFLDHDLGGKPPEYYGQDCDPSHPNTGSEVIRWMTANAKSGHVIVHSRNSQVVPVMLEQLKTIPNSTAVGVPFHDLAAHWGEQGIW
jgi:CheY-like chemotaxis protein